MKKFSVLLSVVLLAVAVVPQAFADYLVTGDKVTVTAGTDRGSTTGGPFKLAVTSPAKSIQTFCLETGEHVAINGKYYVQISDRAMAGGTTGSPPPGDVISYATARLYSDWLDGKVYTTYLNTNGWNTKKDVNDAVQNAIWKLEGEGGSANEIYTAYYNVKSNGTDLDGVRDNDFSLTGVNVATLWANSNYTGNCQDMLNKVPEPASMAVWGLLATALGGGLYLRRRRAQ